MMGVSGVGKTTVGLALAARLDVEYVDGDDLHSEAAREQMAQGVALSDQDRLPWLERVGSWLAAREQVGGVVSCSALRRSYRDVLRTAAPSLRLLHLTADHDVVAHRMAGRDHFMPGALLSSQESTLEPPAADEHAVTLDASAPPAVLADAFLRA